MTCENCGMYYMEWGYKDLADLMAGDEPLYYREHVCPEPFPRGTAEYLLRLYSSSDIPTTSTIKARIRLGRR